VKGEEKQKSRVDVINDIDKATEKGDIEWNVEIENKFVRATYHQELTPSKKIVYKIVYYLEQTKSTSLHINFLNKIEGVTHSKTIMDLGGSKRRNEVKLISHILNKILLKEEDERLKVNIEIEDVFTVGDRVVVIKPQDFNKDEIVGQKGTIIKEVDRVTKTLYLVKFDNHFHDVLFGEESFFGGTVVREGNCWLMEFDSIKKIKDRKPIKMDERIVKSAKEFTNFFKN